MVSILSLPSDSEKGLARGESRTTINYRPMRGEAADSVAGPRSSPPPLVVPPGRHRGVSLDASESSRPPRPSFMRLGAGVGGSLGRSAFGSQRDLMGRVGDSIRRISLDANAAPTAFQEEIDKQDSASSVSDYHEAFQQTKQENPTVSMGALHHLTLTKMGKAKREEQERRKQEERQRKEEEERLRDQTPAKKAVDKWVCKIKRTIPLHERNNNHHQQQAGGDPSSESTLSEVSVVQPITGGNGDALLTHLIPTGTRAGTFLRRQGSGIVGPAVGLRRASNDSGGSAETGCSNHSNLAPRRSVGEIDKYSEEELFRSVSSSGGFSLGGLSAGGSSHALSDASRLSPNHNEEEDDDDDDEGGCAKKYKNKMPKKKDAIDDESRARSSTADGDLIVGFLDRSRDMGIEEEDEGVDYDGGGLIVGFGDRGNRPSHKWRPMKW